jgi:hypothetical protein
MYKEKDESFRLSRLFMFWMLQKALHLALHWQGDYQMSSQSKISTSKNWMKFLHIV